VLFLVLLVPRLIGARASIGVCLSVVLPGALSALSVSVVLVLFGFCWYFRCVIGMKFGQLLWLLTMLSRAGGATF